MSSPWWVDAVTYQVYVRSFCDSDGDGVGDLPGIRSKLPYLAELGVDALWLTPFYRSPMADHGYDVSDHYDVDPMFGTLADLDALVVDAHALGLKVVIDLVPNHTSNEHPWFMEAVADPASPARHRYLFRDPAPDGGPPNNWTSVFGGPAWTLDEASGQYYLHLFAPEQPDLNWHSQEVHDEWDRVVRFWLDRRVDGFRIDVAHGLYKHPELASNPEPDPVTGVVSEAHMWDLEEVHDVYRRWRRICDTYEDRAMVGELFLEIDRMVRYARSDELHLAFNFALVSAPFDAAVWRPLIEASLALHAEVGALTSTWVLSSHDVVRHATRYGGGETGRRRAMGAALTTLALPGAPYLYQGEELGLEDAVVAPEQRQDPIWTRSGGTVQGRDGCRAPLPWDSEPPGYGFTTGTPWLPFSPEAGARSVAAQTGVAGSFLERYREAIAVRRTFRGVPLVWCETPDGVLAFTRGELTCVLNTSPVPVQLDVAGELRLASTDDTTCRDGRLVLPPDAAAWVVR